MLLSSIGIGGRIAIGLAIAGSISFSVIIGYEVHHLSRRTAIGIMAGVVATVSVTVYFLVTWLAQH